MSGGGIFVERDLIGINGRSSHPILSNYIYEDGTKPTDAEIQKMRAVNWGIPLHTLLTYIRRLGTRAGWFARLMFKGRRTKHWMRTIYGARSILQLKKGLMTESAGEKEYWQAGRSVAGIHAIEPAGEIVRRFADHARKTLLD